ncbi:MAG: hypothetical protein ABR573_07180 [Candidatus Dormibacteria bacterium]
MGYRVFEREQVLYKVPFGLRGEVARRLFVVPRLRQVFDYREQAVRAVINGEAT